MKIYRPKSTLIVKIAAGAFFFFVLAFNIKNFEKSGSIFNDLKLKNLISNANAQGEAGPPNNFLNTYPYQWTKGNKNGLRCYRDATGPDVFEGFEVACVSGGSGCQPADCSKVTGCYTQ